MPQQETGNSQSGCRMGGIWLRRLVSAGLVFFLIKGLIWLAIPGILLWWGSGS